MAQHEKPRNPQAPDVPLPPNVQWIGASDTSRGRYSFSTDSVQDSYRPDTASPAQPSPVLPSPVQSSPEQGSGARAGALPPCLSTKFEGTRWSATDDSKHETAAQAFWASLEHIKGGIVSTAEHGSFCAIVSDSCPAGCTGTDDEVNDCLTVLTKALEKTKGKPSPLFRKICEEDR
jgi:hypothetical protein